MITTIQEIRRGIAQIAFPNVCVCCGHENTEEERQICSFCLEQRFEDANPENNRTSSDTLLPEGLLVQQALWQFDKGGDLQALLHRLKYERLTNIGIDLGEKLGERVKRNRLLQEMLQQEEAIILPVPLHYLKFRYRGFNQAFKIAQGFQKVWSQFAICGIKDVVRSKNTRSQTGFSLEKRQKNMRGAFKVKHPKVFAGKLVIIIDDVFTTGATTFELAKTILQNHSGPVIILTVAQA